jgi:hypothetical protein
MKRFLTSNYITGEMIEPGVRYEHVVVDVGEHHFDGDDHPTALLHLESGEKVALNQTRLRVMGAAFGWNEQNWLGKTIIIYRGTAQYQGKTVPAVAIEPVVATRIGTKPKPRLAVNNPHDEPPPDDDYEPPQEYDGPGPDDEEEPQIPF